MRDRERDIERCLQSVLVSSLGRTPSIFVPNCCCNKSHKLGGLKQHKCIILECGRRAEADNRSGRAAFLLEGLRENPFPYLSTFRRLPHPWLVASTSIYKASKGQWCLSHDACCLVLILLPRLADVKTLPLHWAI